MSIPKCLVSVGPSETRPGTLDFIFVIRFNEGKNRLLTTAFDNLNDDPGVIADSLIANRFANAVRNYSRTRVGKQGSYNRVTESYLHNFSGNIT